MASISKKQIASLLQQAVSHHQKGELDQAEIHYRGILEASPAEPDTLLNYSTLLASRGQLTEAEKLAQKLALVHPKLSTGQFALGNILFQQGKLREAAERFAITVKLNPNDVAAHTNNAKLQYDTGNYAAAIPSLNFLLKREPNNAELLLTRGMAHEFLHHYRQAIDDYDRYRALNPQRWALTTFSMAQFELLLGNYPRGFELFEHRWKLPELQHNRSFTAPLWLGDAPIEGKTLLITREQGFGDTIQFARYVPMLEKMGARVILEVRAPLVTLMRSLSSTVTILAEGDPLPAYDFYYPTMSLAHALKSTVDTLPNTVPYLAPSADKRSEWQTKLGPKTKPRVGLVWSGSATNFLNARRSIPLASLAPLLALPFEFHALQKEILPQDRQAFAEFTAATTLKTHQDSVSDFEDTAAIVEEMDLVLTTCTSLAHLAGALAKPLWMLLSDRADWRWHLNTDRSPWYPTARLFRQTAQDDWSTVIEPVIEALKTTFKE